MKSSQLWFLNFLGVFSFQSRFLLWIGWHWVLWKENCVNGEKQINCLHWIFFKRYIMFQGENILTRKSVIGWTWRLVSAFSTRSNEASLRSSIASSLSWKSTNSKSWKKGKTLAKMIGKERNSPPPLTIALTVWLTLPWDWICARLTDSPGWPGSIRPLGHWNHTWFISWLHLVHLFHQIQPTNSDWHLHYNLYDETSVWPLAKMIGEERKSPVSGRLSYS